MSGIIKTIGFSLVTLTQLTHASFYVGAGFGSDTVDYNQRTYITQLGNPGYPPTFDVINKVHLSATGVFGTLFAGYSQIYNNNCSIAGEVNGNLSSVNHSEFNHEFINASFSDTSIKMNNIFGISILPGYQLAPNSLVYARIGWASNRIRQKTSDTSLANFTQRIDGFRSGLGIKQMINERLAIRMEYSYIAYENTQFSTNDVANRVPKSQTLSPNQQLVEFGLVLNFA